MDDGVSSLSNDFRYFMLVKVKIVIAVPERRDQMTVIRVTAKTFWIFYDR